MRTRSSELAALAVSLTFLHKYHATDCTFLTFLLKFFTWEEKSGAFVSIQMEINEVSNQIVDSLFAYRGVQCASLELFQPNTKRMVSHAKFISASAGVLAAPYDLSFEIKSTDGQTSSG